MKNIRSASAPFPESSMLDVNQLDADTRGVLDELTFKLRRVEKRAGWASEMERLIGRVDNLIRMERRLSLGDPSQRIARDPEFSLILNSLLRQLVHAPLAPEHKLTLRALGEDSGAGSAYIVEKLAPELYDVLGEHGKWATLGVRPLLSKSTKFPVSTANPTAVFVLTEGDGLTEDSAMAGTSVSAEAEVVGCLLTVSMQLAQDMGADLVPDFLARFEAGMNERLDFACFAADGTAAPPPHRRAGAWPHARRARTRSRL